MSILLLSKKKSNNKSAYMLEMYMTHTHAKEKRNNKVTKNNTI